MHKSLILKPLSDRTIDEGKPLTFIARTEGVGPEAIFTLGPEAPKGARIDPKSGTFSWTPSEDQGPGTHRVSVRVASETGEVYDDERIFAVTVNEVKEPPRLNRIDDQVARGGAKVTFTAKASDPDIPPDK